VPFALREARARLRGGFTRCDALPAYNDVHALPAELRGKVVVRASMGPHCTPIAKVYTDGRDVPFSALERFVATCPGTVDLGFQGGAPGAWGINSSLPFSFYARLAQSELVQAVTLDCDRPMRVLL